MATALQKQLAAIAATSTKELDLKAQKAAHGKSLLFDPRVAASQDFNTVYQICYEGFQELCALDSRFLAFEQNLFAEQSKNEERGQMTKAENEELDRVLESFLGLVSSRLLLRPAVKAVEWLVRRFRIHEHNRESTILTFLPYHSHPIFLALLAVLPSQLPPAFRFLFPYVSSRSNPPRHAIVYTASTNQAFLTSFSNQVLQVARAKQQSQIVIAFWASVATQAIDGMLDAARSGRGNIQVQREEDLLHKVLPILNEGLQITHATELITACCMLITVLVSKGNLQEQVLTALMEAVAASYNAQTADACLICLAVIAEARDATKSKLPKAVTRKLLKTEDLVRQLQVLATQYKVGKLALGLAVGAQKRLDKPEPLRAIQLIRDILDADLLDNPQATRLIKSLLGSSETLSEVTNQADVGSGLADLLVHVANSPQYGPIFTSISDGGQFSMDQIELVLRTSLPKVEHDNPKQNQDDAMELDFAAAPSESLDSILGSLPDELPADFAFADSANGTIVDSFALALTQAARADEAEKVLGHRSLARNEALTRPTYFAFLAYSYQSQAPTVARRLALEAVRGPVSDTGLCSKYLLPAITVLFAALSDPLQTLRRASAETIVAIGRSKKASDRTTALQEIRNLFDVVLKFLEPNLEECILDAGHVVRVFRTFFNERSHSAQSEKEHPAQQIKDAIYDMLASQAGDIINVGVRMRALRLLATASKTGADARRNYLYPLIQEWISIPFATVSSRCRNSDVELTLATRQHFGVIGPRETEGLQVLQDIMTGDVKGAREDATQAAFYRLKQIWPNLKAAAQLPLATTLLDLALDSPDASDHAVARDCALNTIRAIDLSSEVLQLFVNSMPSATKMPESPPSAKRRRTSRSQMSREGSGELVDVDSNLRRLTLVLELVEASSPGKHPQLVKGLFHILGELQHFRSQVNSSLVYLQGLIIGSLLSIVEQAKHMQSADFDVSTIRADMLVDVLRHASNPQLQNTTLLLISSLASWQPDRVLHSIMPVFTFLGSSLFRQSDDYSAHVIDQTIERVVPQLTLALKKRNRNLIAGASELLLSFIAAYEHIPLHRRSGLFQRLIQTMGPDDCLFAIEAMLIDRHAGSRNVIQFIVDLVAHFSIGTVLGSFSRYIDLIEDALLPKTKRHLSETVFGLKEKSQNQIDETVLNLITSLAALLQSSQLRTRFTKLARTAPLEAEGARSIVAHLLEKPVKLSKKVKGRADTEFACSDLLKQILQILPPAGFLEAATPLLSHVDAEVRFVMLKAVHAQILSVHASDEAGKGALVAFLPQLTAVVEQSDNDRLQHTGIVCVNQIVERFGRKDLKATTAAIEVIADSSALGSTKPKVRIASLFCLATGVEVLRDGFIPFLPRSVPVVFDYLQQNVSAQEPSSQLHGAGFAFLCSILDSIPFIFSDANLDSAVKISHRSTATSEIENDARSQLASLIATKIDARKCFSTINRCWSHAVETGPDAVREHVDLLSSAINTRRKPAIVENAKLLSDTFVNMFDLRLVWASKGVLTEANAETLDDLEASMSKAGLAMTMKLSDAIFRPHFIRLVDWAAKSLPKSDAAGRAYRSTTFFRFFGTLCDSLKSLVTNYASYVLDSAAEALKSSTNSEGEQPLRKAVLDALTSSFQHDQDEFWQGPSHFDPIVGPLLSQLSMSASNSAFLMEIVLPAIAALGAAGGPENHKEMNALLLKYLRDEKSSVRLAGVKCQRSLTEKLGEDWLALLPEMLPFISELQEDADEEVEMETLRWIKQIEGVLGESLDSMLQ